MKRISGDMSQPHDRQQDSSSLQHLPKLKKKAARAGGVPFRQRLNEVALELFWKNGYRETSTRDIATALGVKQASLYYHVRTKEDVLYDLCYTSLLQVMEKVAAVSAGKGDARLQMRDLFETQLGETLRLHKQFFITIADYRSLSAERIERIGVFWGDHRELVTQIFARGKADGMVRSDIPDKYLYHVPMSTLNWTVLWYKAEGEYGIEKLASIYSALLLEGAARPLAQRQKLRSSIARLKPVSLQPLDVGSNATHARLLEAASSLFAKRGYSTTSLREIAEAMQIEKASLYYYVASKEDLNFEICSQAHEHLRKTVQTAVSAAKTPLGRLLALISAHVSSILLHPDWHATANEQLNALEALRRAQIVAQRDAYEAELREILEQAQAAEILRPDIPARILAFFLLGMLTHVYPWYEPERDVSPKKLGDFIAELFLFGLQVEEGSAEHLSTQAMR